MLRGARCVFAYTTFQLIHKDHLAFFEKKGLEKFRNSFFFYNRQNEMSKISKQNVQKKEKRPS